MNKNIFPRTKIVNNGDGKFLKVVRHKKLIPLSPDQAICKQLASTYAIKAIEAVSDQVIHLGENTIVSIISSHKKHKKVLREFGLTDMWW